jgi:hypothetical protein
VRRRLSFRPTVKSARPRVLVKSLCTFAALIPTLLDLPSLLTLDNPPKTSRGGALVSTRRARLPRDLRLHRTLFLHQHENLTIGEHTILSELLETPVGADLRVARGFLEAWFAIWKDDGGHRRSLANAKHRYQVWQTDANAASFPPLRRQQRHLDADHFEKLSAFLHNPAWESTNNAAERGGRAFRHGQHPHFRLRSTSTMDADLKIRAQLQRERFCCPPPQRLHHCQRGRSTTLPNSATVNSQR